MFISGSMNGALNLGDIEGGKILFTIPAHLRNCNQVQWHPTSGTEALGDVRHGLELLCRYAGGTVEEMG